MIRNRILSVWGGVIRVMVRLDLSPPEAGVCLDPSPAFGLCHGYGSDALALLPVCFPEPVAPSQRTLRTRWSF